MKLLASPPTSHAWTPFKVAIVTGLSRPTSCELSESQQGFLDSLAIGEDNLIRRNFPYVESESNSKVGIIRASFANTSQFLASHRSRFKQLSLPHLRALADSTDNLYLIAGSCGIQLLNVLGASGLRNIEVFAMGPVCFKLPPCPLVTVVGSRDFLAGSFCKKRDHTISNLGHMHYWHSQETRDLAAKWLSSKISEL